MPVLLQLVTARALGSGLIRFGTRGKFSHAEFVRADGWTFGARLSGGVAWRPPSESAADSLVARFAAPKIDAAFRIALTQAGKPYDWRAIASFVLDRDWRSTGAWFCSELVEWAFEQAGAPLLNPLAPVYKISPRDLSLSTQITRAEFAGRTLRIVPGKHPFSTPSFSV